MYRHCIHCSADLGANDAVEAFPVGRTLAFDAEKGRLWAVCPRCARWNLAPLEERWEAVEDGERLFRGCRLRVHSQNVGLARLPDGTRLIRVGRALPGEMAAWRYGRTMIARRRGRMFVAGAAAATGATAAAATVVGVVALAAYVPLVLLGGDGLLLGAGGVGEAAETVYDGVRSRAYRLWHRGMDGRVLARLPAEGGGQRLLRKRDFRGAWLAWSGAGALEVHVPAGGGRFLTLEGTPARSALARGLALLNAGGATRRQVEGAVSDIADAGSAGAWLERAARDGVTLELPPGKPADYWNARARFEGRPGSTAGWVRTQELRVLGDRSRLGTDPYLRMRAAALEMALHEERERRAMDGELAALEEMWRQAEEIAAIADRLPDGA